jgi:flavin-dependent dehydrogenase
VLNLGILQVQQPALQRMPGLSRSLDIAVVGGGPAGAICALMLARGGAHVGLVHWVGYAAGGIELVSGHARNLIERYSPHFFQKASLGIEVHETISLWDTPEPVTFNAMFNPWGAGIAVERPLFDRALRDLAFMAGVSIIDDAKVVGIERSGDQWHLLMRSAATVGDEAGSHASASFLVLATGRVAAQFVDRSPVAEPSGIALMTFLRMPGSGTVQSPGNTLYVERTDNGWWYALPAGDGSYFAGFCTDRDEVKKRPASLKEFFVRELRNTRLLAPLLSAASGKIQISGRMSGAQVFDRLSGEGWIAVGDAAYAPDPLSGMGIELAIESAQLGAHALLKATQGSTQPHALMGFAEYEDAIRERVSRQEKTAAYHYGRL